MISIVPSPLKPETMMTKKSLLFVLFLLQGVFAATQTWTTQTIAPGLVWKNLHADSLFGHPQHINILEVDMRKNETLLTFCADTLIPTSHQAQSAEALAAVNGGFFDMKAGGSVTFLKVKGQILHFSRPKLIEEQSEILRGALWIDEQGHVFIQPAQPDSFYTQSRYHSVLLTGPMLLNEGQPIPLADRPFNTNRHPRTGACITSDKKLLLLTVDGRTAESHGMALPELTTFLQSLGCQNAVNLDGGGSTTMWIQGMPEGGIVNMPCDNKRFDHSGERPVANAIAVMKRK